MFLHIVTSLRERGLRFVFMYFWNAVWFDLVNGTNTAFRREKSGQNVEDPAFKDGLLYVASLDFVIHRTVTTALTLLGAPRGLARFIDVGCGKGKTILYLERKLSGEFSEIIGVEYDPRLVSECQVNLKKINAQKTDVFEESGEHLYRHLVAPAVVYFYNSFQGDTFRKTFDHVKDHKFVLIYVDPVLTGELRALGYKEVKSHSGQYNAESWAIFKSPGLNSSSSITD